MTEIGPSRLFGFQTVDHPGARVLARAEVVPWVRYVLEGGATLHSSTATDREVIVLEGRRPVHVVPAKLPRGKSAGFGPSWTVRRFARGGRVLPKLLGDRYLRTGTPRPFQEARVSEAVRRRGVPTPKVLAAAVYPQGPFYRGDLVTEFVSNATDLVAALFDSRRRGPGGAMERLEALQASGALIRTMASAGLSHRDLHAGNILLQWEGSAPRALILDLDLSRLAPEGISSPRGPMAKRLRRSLRKWESRTGVRLSEREWATLHDALGG